MTTTPVGMRCPECAKQRTRVKRVRDATTVPRVTYALLLLNVAVFFAERNQFTLFSSGANGKVIDEGILYRTAISEGHDYYRLVTAGFLHENLIHIAFNMYLLYVLGMMLEPAIGSLRFAAIYAVALLAGSFGALLATDSATLGASGAIFGLMGAAAVELRARGFSVMQSGIGGLIIINLIFSFTFANISVGAHVGGLAGGALAGLAIRTADRRGQSWLGFAACALLGVVAVAAAIAASKATGSGFA
jgi:membrane associated rhomboid family serine protease